MKELAKLQLTIAGDVLRNLLEEVENNKDEKKVAYLDRLLKEAEENYAEALECFNNC